MRMAGLCGLLLGGLAVAAQGAETPSHDGARDFDFLMGSWNVHNRRLRERLKGSTTWDEFEATNVARPLLGGIGNEDVYRTEYAGGFTGMSFRFYDKAKGEWSIYWADSRRGVLDPPVVGSFARDVGTFEGADVFEGRPIRVRFIWSRVTTPTPRWEQAFSADGGKTWETNWTMEFTRKEHAARMNDRLLDAGNVLLLRPLAPGRGLRVLPAVDVVSERAGGIVVMQVFAVQPGKVDALAGRAEESFGAYRAAGAREAGVLVSLERPNNFPRHAARDDGPFLVWVGVVKDDAILNEVAALAGRAAASLGASGLLRGDAEWIAIDPTGRSRLRWR